MLTAAVFIAAWSHHRRLVCWHAWQFITSAQPIPQASLILKTTLLPTTLVFDLELEDYAVKVLRRKLASES